jgi:hypothetical protein
MMDEALHVKRNNRFNMADSRDAENAAAFAGSGNRALGHSISCPREEDMVI